jgi:hypothetical protein
MFGREITLSGPTVRVSGPIIQAIEDAILFGNVNEIDGILEMVREDNNFPQNLRNALESMRYFRQYYGRGGILEPVLEEDVQRALRMEAAWGREVIEMIGHYPDMTEAKYA